MIGAGLEWRDVTILRTVANSCARPQSRSARPICSRRWLRNPDVAALLVALFHARTIRSHDDDRVGAEIAPAR